MTEPEFLRQVQALRPQLLRFAQHQLRNAAWAEDAVSETVVAALERPQSYAGAAALKTWLVGILKHKLVDQIRRHGREVLAADLAQPAEDDGGADLDELLFDAQGHWREPPADWGAPGVLLAQKQFMAVLETCVERLPGQQGRVFLMREWLELDTAEICEQTGVNAGHLFVLLHRARLRLRECLQLHWFAPAGLPVPGAAAPGLARG